MPMTIPADKFCRARITERKDFAANLWTIRIDWIPEKVSGVVI